MGTVVWCVLFYVMMSVCGQASEWSHVGTDEYVQSALHMWYFGGPRAIEELEAAARGYPTHPQHEEIVYRLADLYFEEGRIGDAHVTVTAMLQRCSERGRTGVWEQCAQVLAARCVAAQGRTNEALAQLEALLRARPDVSVADMARLAAARLWMGQEELNQAEKLAGCVASNELSALRWSAVLTLAEIAAWRGDVAPLIAQLELLGAERFFDAVDTAGLLSLLRAAPPVRAVILPEMLNYCFRMRSLVYPPGIRRVQRMVAVEAFERGRTLFAITAQEGPDNAVRLAALQWYAAQRSGWGYPGLSNAVPLDVSEALVANLAVETNLAKLLATCEASASITPLPPSAGVLYAALLEQADVWVQQYLASGQRTAARNMLIRLSGVLAQMNATAAHRTERYETAELKLFRRLWPLSTDEMLYESAGWVIRTLNCTAAYDVIYLRMTDEYHASWPWSTLDMQTLMLSRPAALRARVREDCKQMLTNYSVSFAQRDPALPRPGELAAYRERNRALLALAAAYGEHDLIERARQHEDERYHELAREAVNSVEILGIEVQK